jgi:chromosome segregation ATPase
MILSDDSKPDPAVLLLDEIEKLLAQTRSMELHLEQAHATAEEKMTRLQEHIQQLDGVRRSNEEEIAALRHQVVSQEQALTGRHEAVTAVELALHGRIHTLQQDLAQRVREVADRDRAIEMLNSETAMLRERFAASESHTPDRESDGTLRQEPELNAGQSSAPDSERRLRAKVHEMQIQLADKQLLADRRATEIEDLRAAVTRLSAQLASRESGEGESKGEVVNESSAIRATRRAEIIFSKEQEFAMTNDQDEPLVQSAAETGAHGAPPASLEQSLRDEVYRLIHEAQEKNQILQDRNDELVRVKAEMDRLHDRLNHLESSRSQAESALRDDAERMRTEFQAQLALLQAELSQREWALEERQAEARGQEQHLRQEIDSLRQQLVKSKTTQQHDTDAFVFGEPRASDAGEQHFEDSGNAGRGDGYSGSFARRRRWQSGFGWKRRWRS